MLDAADGSVTWQTDSVLYNRKMRLDAGRKRIVAIEQADATDAVHYEVASYDLRTGHRATLQSRDNVVPTSLTVGDLGGRAGDEYAVAESSFDENYLVNASTVRIVGGDSADTLRWSNSVKRDDDDGGSGPSVFGMTVADGKLITSAQDNDGYDGADNIGGSRYGALTVYSGSGTVKWQSRAPPPRPCTRTSTATPRARMCA